MNYKKSGNSDKLIKDIKVLVLDPCVQDGPEDVGAGKVDQCGKVMYAGDSDRGKSVHKGKEKY